MIGEYSNVKIQGMAAAVPEYVEENQMFESVLGARRTKKQIRLTGVSKRHVAGPRQRTSDLCYVAATRLLDKLQWDKKEIKILIMVTQSANYEIPSTAFFMQKRLGLEKDCVVFDINLGCSSFTSGVHVVSALLQNCNIHDKALLVVGDTSGAMLRPESSMQPDVIADRMIFGSAGAAVALEKVENNSIKFLDKSDGNGFDAIICYKGGGTEMNGEQVFEFAINDVSNDVLMFKNHFKLQEEDIDYYIFHQAQKLILDNIAASCDIPEEKELRSLGEYGNTSGTSVPVSVCANIDKFSDKENVNLLLCGFGIGLSWGIVYSEIPVENILPIIETNEHYDEDKKPKKGLQEKTILVYEADTDMGENLCRFLDEKSANVILIGDNLDKLKEIQSDLFMPSYVLNFSGKNREQQVIDFCQKNGLELDGIIYPNVDKKNLSMLHDIEKLLESEIINPATSIVLLSSDNESEDEIQSQLQQLKEQGKDKKIRVNAVLYDSTALNMVQVTGSGRKWIEYYLQNECPDSMKRVLDVNRAAMYLLGNNSKFISCSILRVDM